MNSKAEFKNELEVLLSQLGVLVEVCGPEMVVQRAFLDKAYDLVCEAHLYTRNDVEEEDALGEEVLPQQFVEPPPPPLVNIPARLPREAEGLRRAAERAVMDLRAAIQTIEEKYGHEAFVD